MFTFVDVPVTVKKIIIRNLTRPDVDFLFRKKHNCLEEIVQLKIAIENSIDKNYINNVQNKISKLYKDVQKFDTAAREKDKQIINYINQIK